jgi:hypothetical protein
MTDINNRGEREFVVPSASLGKDQGQLEARREVAPPEWFNMNSAPKDGTRIRVMHELATYHSDVVTAVWDGERWSCSEFFIDPGTMFMYKQPTHWTPLSVSDGSPQGQDAKQPDPTDDSAVGNAETPLPPPARGRAE